MEIISKAQTISNEVRDPSEKRFLAALEMASKLLALPLIVVIVIYQKTLSPDHGFLRVLYPYGYCRFHPTCSMYARQVLIADGILGLPKIIRRLINCRPGVPAGIDLP